MNIYKLITIVCSPLLYGKIQYNYFDIINLFRYSPLGCVLITAQDDSI